MSNTQIDSVNTSVWRRRFKCALFILWALFFLAGVVYTIILFKTHGLGGMVELLHNFIDTRTDQVILMLLGLYVLRSIIFIPASVLGTAIGIIFADTPLLAILIGSIGAICSSVISFAIARVLGREWVEAHENERLRKFDEMVSRRGFFTIFILRILLFIPFDFISLFSGFSSIRFRDYFWGNAFGVVPEIAIQVLLGSAILNPWNLITLGGIFCVVFGLGYYLKTHPHFREFVNPAKQYRRFREKRDRKKIMRGKRKKRF